MGILSHAKEKKPSYKCVQLQISQRILHGGGDRSREPTKGIGRCTPTAVQEPVAKLTVGTIVDLLS